MHCKQVNIKRTKYCSSDLTKKIKIQERKQSNRAGEYNTNFTYTTLFSPWAGIIDIKGFTTQDGVQINDGASKKFIVRYNSAITSELYLELNDNLYEILLVNNVEENNEWMELRTKLLGDKDLKGAE
jgi:SPP1 family predicted phage head-tail adaptor